MKYRCLQWSVSIQPACSLGVTNRIKTICVDSWPSSLPADKIICANSWPSSVSADVRNFLDMADANLTVHAISGSDPRAAVVMDGAARAAAFEALGSPMQASRVRSQHWYGRPLSPVEAIQRTYVQKGCHQMDVLERCAPPPQTLGTY